MFFAVFVFEPSSPERFLALYPFVVLLTAAVLGQTAMPRPAAIGVWACFAMLAGSHLFLFSKGHLERTRRAEFRRIEILQRESAASALVFVPTHRDPLYVFRRDDPFHRLNLGWSNLRVRDAVESGTMRALTWRKDFACHTLDAWRLGAEVWLSSRLLAHEPRPQWQWVEGDDRRLSWTQLPDFFSCLRTSRDIGGADGFRLVNQSPENQRLLTELCLSTP